MADTPEPLDSILSHGRSDAVTEQTAPAEQATPQGDKTVQSAEGSEQPPSDDAQEVTTEAGRIPFGKLRQAEREKGRKEAEAVSEQKLRERDEAWERRFSQFVEIAKPKQEAPPKKDLYEDPDGYVEQKLQERLSPIENRLREREEQISKIDAVQTHGAEVVNQAFESLKSRMAEDPGALALHRQIMSTGHPWNALVQWHNREQRLAPDYEEKLKQKHLEEFRREHGLAPETNGDGQAQQRPPVMPTNLATARNVGQRTGPAWSGPPQIADIFNRKRNPA